MKVCIAGMTQVGSTRVYNILRLILEEVYGNVTSGYTTYVQKTDNPHKVIKLHGEATPNTLSSFDFVFLPIRDPRDAAISYLKRSKRNKDINATVNQIKENVGRFYRYASGQLPPNYMIVKYESYNIEMVTEIANFIGISLDASKIKDIYNQVENMFDLNLPSYNMQRKVFFNSKELLSPEHNTSGGASGKYLTYFTEDENKILIDKLTAIPAVNKFMTLHGYKS